MMFKSYCHHKLLSHTLLIRSTTHSRITTGFTTRDTRLVPQAATYPSPAHEFTPVRSRIRVAQSLVFYLVLCSSLFAQLSLFFWSLYCLSVFNLRLGIFKIFLQNDKPYEIKEYSATLINHR